MKLYSKFLFLPVLAATILVSCSDDDMVGEEMAIATCTDGIKNGDETDVDCGGSACEPCETAVMPDFSGTYAQADFMGRPGISTVFIADVESESFSRKDAYNEKVPAEMAAAFRPWFETRLEAYHDVYANLLGANPEDVNYETNILGLDITALTGYLAADVLEVAPNHPTTYFNPGADFDNDGRILVPDGDEIGLTGRTLQDDVIDVSLILLFGGMEGDRFSGQDDGNGGMLPRLTSDGVAFTATPSDSFPYLGAPE